jgi:hypothetical protein
VHEGPARQNCARDLPFITRGVGNNLPEPAGNDHARQQRFGLVTFGQFDGGAAAIRTGQVASEHQVIERRVFNPMIDVGAQHREQLLASGA